MVETEKGNAARTLPERNRREGSSQPPQVLENDWMAPELFRSRAVEHATPAAWVNFAVGGAFGGILGKWTAPTTSHARR